MYHVSTTTSFLLWHLWKEKNVLFSWGGILALIIHFSFWFLSTCTTTSALGTCGLEQTRYTEFCRPFLSFCPFFDAFWCSFVLECLCRYVLFLLLLFFFWSCAWKDCTNGLCFCFAFMCFLFLARRHALIRDAPDDLYFSPPCFFSFCNIKQKKKRKKNKKK